METIPQVLNPRVGNADYFWYGTRVTGLQSTAPNATSILNIDADSDFWCIGFSYQADIAGAALTEATNLVPLINLQINDTGSGKSLMNVPAPLTDIAGDGKHLYRLLRPRVFLSNASVQFNWTSYVAAGTVYNVSFTMHGIKVYK